MAQVAEHLPGKYEALNPTSRTTTTTSNIKNNNKKM
jgi:hypothetical protein